MTTIKLSSKQELEVYHNKTIEVNKKGYKMYIRQDMNGTPKAYDIAYGLTHMTYIFTKEN